MPDINSASNEWVAVYATTGITAGTPIAIQNKNNLHLLVQESATQPDIASNDGLMLQYSEEVYLDGAELVWIRGSLRQLHAFVWEQ